MLQPGMACNLDPNFFSAAKFTLYIAGSQLVFAFLFIQFLFPILSNNVNDENSNRHVRMLQKVIRHMTQCGCV